MRRHYMVFIEDARKLGKLEKEILPIDREDFFFSDSPYYHSQIFLEGK